MIFAFEGIDGSGKSTALARTQSWLSQLGYKVLASREPGGSKRGDVIRTLLLNGRARSFDDDDHKMIDMNIDHLSLIIEKSRLDHGDLSRQVLELSKQRELTHDLELTLFIVSRIIHLEEVLAPYVRGETDTDCILIDRFWLSTYAYQIMTRCQSIHDRKVHEYMLNLFEWHLNYLKISGVYPRAIIFDVDPEIALGRINARGEELTAFDLEKIPFFQSVRKGFWDIYRNAALGHQSIQYDLEVYEVDAGQEEMTVFGDVQKIILECIQQDQIEFTFSSPRHSLSVGV